MIDRDAERDVMIGFVHNGTVAAVFMNSFVGVLQEDAARPRHRIGSYHDAIGPYIHDNRARVARYFLDHTAHQWLWFLDIDVQIPRDGLYRLLACAEEQDIKILGAAYWNGYDGWTSRLAWLHFDPEVGMSALTEMPTAEEDEPVEMTAVGMGCTLIHRDALQDVSDYQRSLSPDDPWDTFGADLMGDQHGNGAHMGEDVTFCLRARRVGHLTYGLPSLVVEHMKPQFMRHGRPAGLPQPELTSQGGISAAI